MSGGLAKKCMLLMLGSLVGQLLVFWMDICAANTLHLDMIYRYSNEFKALMQARNKPVVGWTKEGTLEHYEKLVKRDRHRHASRKLTSSSENGSYSLSPTNETTSVDDLGGLHYSLITIGTPGLTFLVALDTGSDLLWVPCHCQECSPTNWASYGLQSQNLEFSVYNQSNSNTSKYVACSDSLCSSTLSSSNCTSANERCEYVLNYASADTSTSGVIMEDVLYLKKSETSNGGSVTITPIYFGCAQVQTGDLVEGVAPDGLFGLGPEDISIPSTLARNGLVSKSFSMCFSSSDSSGRLVFGSQGKKGLQNTSLIPTNPSVYYVVMATKLAVDKDSVGVSQNLVFDTGTSYTTLPKSVHQHLGEIFNQKIKLPLFHINGAFDYCWNISDSNDLNSLPGLTITFSGGSTWDISTPYVYSVDSLGNVQSFCLGIISSSIDSIIGHNFMGGFEFFFDRESMIFSWASSNCYNINASMAASRQESTTINKASTPSSPSPSPNSHGTQYEPNRALHSLCIFSFHLILFFSFMTLILSI